MERDSEDGTGGVNANRLLEAYRDSYGGYSCDRVIADPELNSRFVERCRVYGIGLPPSEINRALMNIRKGNGLSQFKTTRRTSFPNQEQYQFAAEIAARYLERKYGISIDSIICDPDKAAEFDHAADSLCVGYTPLQFRWAALRLRKQRSLKPEHLSQLVSDKDVHLIKIDDVAELKIPASPGLYIFLDSDAQRALYVGEASNLFRRIKKHLDHSDNKGLARWLWQRGMDDLWLEYHVLSDYLTTKQRRALENELIQSRRPVFNMQG